MSVERNPLFFTHAGLADYTVRSALPVDLHKVVMKDKNTNVYADEIVVSEEVSTAGHSLAIICRVLRFLEGGSINGSGVEGMPSFLADLRIEAPPGVGIDGPTGSDAGPGGNAATITIVCSQLIGKPVISVKGGKGGRGQDGGHGRQGSNGTNGAHRTVKNNNATPPECVGGQGGLGGKAGLPGRSGAGGLGGNVFVYYQSGAEVSEQLIHVENGENGAIAEPGNPGKGGLAGLGGTVTKLDCEYSEHLGIHDLHIPRILLTEMPSDVFAEKFPLGTLAFTESDIDSFSELNSAKMLGYTPVSNSSVLRREYCKERDHWTAGTLGPGSDGDEQIAEVAKRQAELVYPAGIVSGTTPGINSGSKKVVIISAAEFSQKIDRGFLDMLFFAAENEYMSQGDNPSKKLLSKIHFLLDLCQNYPTPDSHMSELLERAYSMARKVSLGLDIYGYSRARIPLISFEDVSSWLDRMLPLAIENEKHFDAYWAYVQESGEQEIQLKEIYNQSLVNSALIKNEEVKVRADAEKLLKEIPSLDGKVSAAYSFLMTAQALLDAAIKRKSEATKNCNLVGTLTAAATIVAGVASGGAGFVAAAAATKKLYDDYSANDESFGKLWDNRAVLQDDLVNIGKGAGDIVASIKEIQNAVQSLTPEERKLPKFIMERKEFDKVAEEFAELPAEAAAYREAGYNYLACVEARNQAILDYNSMLVQWVEIKAKGSAAQRISDGIESALNTKYDPASPMLMVLLNRLYLDTLALSAKMVHMEKKALAYHFGRASSAPLSGLDIARINAEHIIASGEWITAKQNSYSGLRRLEDGALRFNLEDLVIHEEWEVFKKYGVVSFVIRRNHRKYRAILAALPRLRVTGVALDVIGVDISGGGTHLPWTLSHSGRENVYDAAGVSTFFSHNALMLTILSPINHSESILSSDFSEKGLYSGVSPFATWHLKINNDALAGVSVNLKNVTKVEFRFSGYFVEG